LQSFPDSFVFPYATQRNLTLIGNAVPPMLGHIIAKRLIQFDQGVLSETELEFSSDFCYQPELQLTL